MGGATTEHYSRNFELAEFLIRDISRQNLKQLEGTGLRFGGGSVVLDLHWVVDYGDRKLFIHSPVIWYICLILKYRYNVIQNRDYNISCTYLKIYKRTECVSNPTELHVSSII